MKSYREGLSTQFFCFSVIRLSNELRIMLELLRIDYYQCYAVSDINNKTLKLIIWS